MSDFIFDQSALFSQTIIFGAAMGFAYDILRILRNIIRHNCLARASEDFLYWITCAWQMFILLEKYNYGGLRFYVIVGVGLGITAYLKTLSPFFVKGVSRIGNAVKRKILAVEEKIKTTRDRKVGIMERKICAWKEFLKMRTLRFFRNGKKKLTKGCKMIKIVIRKN